MMKKKMLFVLSMRLHKRNPWINLSIEQAKRGTQLKACYEALIERQYNSATPEQLDCFSGGTYYRTRNGTGTEPVGI